jgi:streptogrisin D
MRRHDSPGGRGAADGSAPDTAARGPGGGNADLLRRLEALRASHPSSPDYGEGDAEPSGTPDGLAGDPAAANESAAADESAADESAADESATQSARDAGADDQAAADDQAGADDEAAADGRGLGGPRGLGPGSLGGHGRRALGPPGPLHSREPYQPWFSSGEPAEPWFTADPGDPPG